MKTFYSLFLSSALLLSLLVTSCADQLNINPKGVLADDLLLGKPEHIDDFVTPCYSLIPYLPWSDRLSSLCGTLCYSVVSYDTPSVLLSIKIIQENPSCNVGYKLFVSHFRPLPTE